MMTQASLDTIGLKYGTDKASMHHDYLNFYELFFAPIRNNELSILEVGVFNGQSLSTWAEYFPNARIIGVDIVPLSKRFVTDRIAIEIADQSNVQQLINVVQKHGPFDIVIEDGSHMCEHQITTLRTIFPFLKDKGIYIVEDLQTNYGNMLERFRGIATSTCVDYLKRWLDLRVADDQIDITQIEDAFLRTYGRSIGFMAFYRRACLIKKNWIISETDSKIINDDALRAISEPVLILAHFSDIGDIEQNSFINCIKNNNYFEIQGLSISSEANVIEYKVRYPDGTWSNWVAEGEFVGSRGKHELLRGVAVRVKSDVASQYSVRATGRFVGVSGFIEAFDGREITSEAQNPLCALQVDLAPRRKLQL
jgi:hypothetical protein